MFKKVLVPLDGSSLAEIPLGLVEDLAAKMGSEITLIRIVTPLTGLLAGEGVPVGAEQLLKQETEEAQRYLSGVAERLKAQGQLVRWVVEIGRPEEKIIEYAEQNGFDLIAMATHGRGGVMQWAFGSVAARILQGTSVPILLVRAVGSERK
ncbi:MAG: universal stress protein [Chloroflexi bacterium]|nr:universal stress protein [Chloroflexota bacterium]